MRYLFTLFATVACLAGSIAAEASGSSSSHGEGSSIAWLTNYEEALNQAKATSKPIVLFFTGSDWCTWCNKLDKESLETEEFYREVGDKIIFVKVDFPLYSPLDAKTTKQNKRLQDLYHISSFPTLIIIDKNEKEIGTTGYLPGGGKKYADHLKKIVGDHLSFQNNVDRLNDTKHSFNDLKKLYEKADDYNDNTSMLVLINEGLKSDKDHYFLKEKYRFLCEEGLSSSEEAKQIRTQLLKGDPFNKKSTHYEVAVIDFQTLSEKLQKEHKEQEEALEPLIAYVEEFGSTDKEHGWKVQMLISQVYLTSGKLPQSLKYAQASLKTSPESIQKDIERTIINLRNNIAKGKSDGKEKEIAIK